MKQEKGILLIEVLIALLLIDACILSLLKYQWQSQKQLQSFERRFMATVHIDNATERLLAGDTTINHYLKTALTPFISTVSVSLTESAEWHVIEVEWVEPDDDAPIHRTREVYQMKRP